MEKKCAPTKIERIVLGQMRQRLAAAPLAPQHLDRRHEARHARIAARRQQRLLALQNDTSVTSRALGVYMGNFWIDSKPIKEDCACLRAN